MLFSVSGDLFKRDECHAPGDLSECCECHAPGDDDDPELLRGNAFLDGILNRSAINCVHADCLQRACWRFCMVKPSLTRVAISDDFQSSLQKV